MKPVRHIRGTYLQNKSNTIGDTCYCPSCGQMFVKTHYAQAFCKTKSGTKCKDKYWNTVIETKRNNTTRISPANQAWQDKRAMRVAENSVYGLHPFEGLNDDEYKNH